MDRHLVSSSNSNEAIDASSLSDSFSVMMFNVLADHLADTFPMCRRDYLVWEYRKHNLLAEILRWKPSILMLAECTHFEDWFLPQLKAVDYDGIFLSKTFDGIDGCALFWRASKYRLSDKREISYRDSIDGDIKPKQVALLAVLSSISNNGEDPCSSVCIATTHLKAKPEYEPLRVNEARLLFEHIDCWPPAAGLPLIVAGDFNSEPQQQVYSLITTCVTTVETGDSTFGAPAQSCVVEQPISNLKSAYRYYRCNDNKNLIEPEYTTWKIRGPGREYCRVIDYIFHGDSLKVTALLSLPTKDCIPPERLPCEVYSSDHFAILAYFTLL